jgi:lipopolysaccharide/colanic/teichoic acid biosynthesis glycosyltransferase
LVQAISNIPLLEHDSVLSTDSYVYSTIDRYDVSNYLILNSPNAVDLEQLEQFYYSGEPKLLANEFRINNIRYINKYFEAVNEKLLRGDLYLCAVESSGGRKMRLLKKYPPIINRVYYFGDFIFKRVFPKLPVTKWVYFKITEGRNRVISATECLGRLYSCGFRVLETELVDNITYVLAEKIGDPDFNQNPSYGALISLNRVGKEGKPFKVYKFRTMHPYSEYLQEYVNEHCGLQEGGKFKNDPRVTTLGRIFRKYWLDELPMIWNFVKGDMKLIGVRPLSRHYLSLYPAEFRERRIHYKPGLLPPFYADMPKNIEEIVDSERRYFDEYDRRGRLADVSYFFKIAKNILIKKARSK